MNAAAKLPTYGVALAVVFGTTWEVGSAVGPHGDGTTGAPEQRQQIAAQPAPVSTPPAPAEVVAVAPVTVIPPTAPTVALPESDTARLHRGDGHGRKAREARGHHGTDRDHSQSRGGHQ
jgi:hypothetical protein